MVCNSQWRNGTSLGTRRRPDKTQVAGGGFMLYQSADGYSSRSGNKKASSEDEAFLFILVGRAGLEPATNGLKVRCSTN